MQNNVHERYINFRVDLTPSAGKKSSFGSTLLRIHIEKTAVLSRRSRCVSVKTIILTNKI